MVIKAVAAVATKDARSAKAHQNECDHHKDHGQEEVEHLLLGLLVLFPPRQLCPLFQVAKFVGCFA